MSEDRLPFLGKPIPRWRARTRDWSRKPLLVRQLLVVSAVATIALPLLYLGFLRHDETLSVVPESTDAAPEPFDFSQVVPPPVHNVPTIPHHGGIHVGDDADASSHVNDAPHMNDNLVSNPADPVKVAEPSETAQVEPPQPITFALIMWSEHSASEGAILMKVRGQCTQQFCHGSSYWLVCHDVHLCACPLLHYMRR